jgi:DNA-binding MarR family transcriptional regulator
VIVTAHEILHSHGILLRRCQQVALAMFTQEAGDLGFSPTQYSALAFAYIEPGIHQNVLGERIALDRSSVTKCLEGLESRGFIRRNVDPKDKRARLLHITPEGEEMLKQVSAAARRARERFHATLGEAEFGQLMDQLSAFGRVLDRVDETDNG